MVENITERRARDEQIATLNVELKQRVAELTAVNAELESFNYSVSHDLRAPLRHIDGFSRILVEDFAGALPEAARRYLGLICEGCPPHGKDGG